MLARAINNFKSSFGKKIKVYSHFSKCTSKDSLCILKDHLTESPLWSPSILTASLGIIVLSVDAFGLGASTLVITSINFMHSLILFSCHVSLLYLILYIVCLFRGKSLENIFQKIYILE